MALPLCVKVAAIVCSDKKLMADYTADMRSKTGMKTLFGKKNIKKDNTEGKVSSANIADKVCWEMVPMAPMALLCTGNRYTAANSNS